MEKIHELTSQIVSGVLESPRLERKELEEMVLSKIKISLLSIVLEYSAKEDVEYFRMLQEQSKYRVGTMEYNKIGQQLSILKFKKAAANRAIHNVKKDVNYKLLRNYCIEKLGDGFLIEFNQNLEL